MSDTGLRVVPSVVVIVPWLTNPSVLEIRGGFKWYKITLVSYCYPCYPIGMDNTQQPPAARVQDATKEVLVNVVLDRSGSMESCRAGTISGYNEYLKGLKADKDSAYSVSLVQFDSPNQGPELTVSYADKPLADVPDLDAKGYEPRGMTPLYDAVGECIRRVDSKGRAVLTVIITDGMENASHEFTQETVKKLIKEKESEGWKFVFLGANIDSAAVGGAMGVAVADCANYAVGNESAVYATMSASAMRYASATRTHGIGSVQARAAASPLRSERSAMLGGGRPAVPPSFRPPAHKPTAPTATRPKTKWEVRSEVSSS